KRAAAVGAATARGCVALGATALPWTGAHRGGAVRRSGAGDPAAAARAAAQRHSAGGGDGAGARPRSQPPGPGRGVVAGGAEGATPRSGGGVRGATRNGSGDVAGAPAGRGRKRQGARLRGKSR